MRPETQQRLQKIKKASVIFRAICKVLSVVVAFGGAAAVVTVVGGRGGINYGGVAFQTAGLSLGHRFVLSAVTAVTWAVLFKCFYHLQHFFGGYSRGEIFTRESAGQLRKFGIACVLWGVMNFLWIFSLAISLRPTQTFPAHVDSFAIGDGAVIVLIAWFMDMAVDLREENELTI